MSATFWTMARVAEALRDQLAAPAPAGAATFGSVSTDTRTIAPGALFVALRGENHDAHDHLADAVAKGATGLVVSDARRASGLAVPVYPVDDTLHALGALGRRRRSAWGKPVIGVTGSNGKTSTKELLRAALGARFRVHATQGNLNNQIGVPLTLLAIPDDAEIAVVEMGTRLPGEIALLRSIAERLSRAPQVPGRLELLHDDPAVLRDYAHTPDALERALGAVRPFATARLIVVFGCGGDRDKGKRPVMGDIASRMADIAIVTSDNPRTEDPERILDEIEAGMGGRPHERVEDRRAAIARALEIAGPDDVIVLAGKGHETYQVRGTVKLHFDEKEIVQELTAGTR